MQTALQNHKQILVSYSRPHADPRESIQATCWNIK